MVEFESAIAPEVFNSIVDLLGGPQGIKLGYRSENYGSLNDEMKAYLGEEAEISTDAFSPVEITVASKIPKPGEARLPIMSGEKLKEFYSKTLVASPTGLQVSTAVLAKDGRVLNGMDGQHVEKKSQAWFMEAFWLLPRPNMQVIANHHSVDARYRVGTNAVTDLLYVLDQFSVKHSIGTYDSNEDFNRFVSDWS